MKLNDIKVLIAKGQKDPKKLTEEEVTTLKSFQEIDTTIGLTILITLSCVVSLWFVKAKLNENSKL